MPIVAVNCAAPKYRRSGEKHEVPLQDCLSCAATRQNTCHFTYELLSSMFAQQQDRGERISTTTLTSKCLRSETLKRQRDFAEDPEKLWAAFRGTLLHGQLEQHAAPGCIEEARYHVELPGLGSFSGSPDLVDVENGVLYDYKTNKENPRYNYPWADHANQVQINRWLVDNATSVEYCDETYDLTTEEHIARFVPARWSALVLVYIDDKGPKPLTVTRSEKVPTVDGKGTKSVRVPDIWDDHYAEDWITDRYREVQAAFQSNTLPPIPSAFEGWQHPLCGYCPKKKECIEVHFADIHMKESA